ncbi:MAG: hypothetical protein L0Z50_37680 [Verrucomicrobiales bacterium]|nr:hypothetical protein [Verrucomicrobiales bacterium]
MHQEANAQNSLVVTYSKLRERTDLFFLIEVSEDAVTWTPVNVEEFEELELVYDPNTGAQRAKLRVQLSRPLSGTRFFRVQEVPAMEKSRDQVALFAAAALPDAEVIFSGISHNRRTLKSTTLARIRNNGTTPIGVPIKLILESISEPTVTVANHDGTTAAGKPFWDFTGQVSGPALGPGETTAMRPLVFDNPLLRPFTLSTSVLSEAAPPATVTLSLTTDGNHSVIMMSEPSPFSGIPTGVGEELTVTVNNTTAPTQVQLDQVQALGGRGQIYFGLTGTALATTATTSGGNPNQAKVPLRYSETSAFQGDIGIRALVNAVVAAEKSVTAITVSVSPKCVYVSDQRPVKQIVTVNPALEALKLDIQEFAVHQDIANPSSLGCGATSITTAANGLGTIGAANGGFQAYFVDLIFPERGIASSVPFSIVFFDKRYTWPCDGKGDPYTESGPGTEYCSTCPNGSDSDSTAKSVDLSDGEKKLFPVDLSIPGRGFDFEFRRAYRGFKNRCVSDRKDFGENWTYTYADEFLVKDGSGADADANYVLFRDGQAGYMFVRIAPGVWAPEIQQFTQLRINPSTGDFEVRDQSGMIEVFHNFSAAGTPNANGRLKEIRDRNGNVMRFLYDQPAGLSKFVLATVIDTMGRSIAYGYYLDSDPNPGRRGRLMEIEDFRRDNSATGRKLNFDYDGEGNLVRVSRPAVIGTPNGNNFPSGKTFRYKYITTADLPGVLTQEQRDRLLHKLTHIWHPNEVRNNPTANPADSLAAERLTYETDPGNPFFGFATAYTVGGLNANGVPAGGIIRYTYTDLNPTRAMGPGNNIDPTPLIHLPSLQTAVQDRNGNQAEYIFGGENKLLEYSEFTRGLRAVEPAKFTMTYRYNKDRLLIQRTFHLQQLRPDAFPCGPGSQRSHLRVLPGDRRGRRWFPHTCSGGRANS